jgi:hypothetical protein
MPATNRFGSAYHVHLFDTVGIDGKGCRDLLLALIHRDLQHRGFIRPMVKTRAGERRAVILTFAGELFVS